MLTHRMMAGAYPVCHVPSAPEPSKGRPWHCRSLLRVDKIYVLIVTRSSPGGFAPPRPIWDYVPVTITCAIFLVHMLPIIATIPRVDVQLLLPYEMGWAGKPNRREQADARSVPDLLAQRSEGGRKCLKSQGIALR
jgi:hypothetical protein